MALPRVFWLQLALLCAMAAPLLHASAAPTFPFDPALRTPDCPQLTHRDQGELLQTLIASSYRCTESVARALRPLANDATIASLLRLAASDQHDLARRNAVRTLGRLADGPPGDPAHELTTRRHATAVRTALHERLIHDQDNYLLQDAVWVLDTFFFPSYDIQPQLARLSLDPARDAGLRERATRANARLIAVKRGPLPASDLAYLRAALQAGHPGVRAYAARAAGWLRDEQLTPPVRAEVTAMLAAAWKREAPLQLPADSVEEIAPWHDAVALESVATDVTARAFIARALDHYQGTQHFAATRSAYEALSLPYSGSAGTITLRSRLAAEQTEALLQLMQTTQNAFFDLLGVAFQTPVAGDMNDLLQVKVFATRAEYREYMRAFVGFGVDVDGIYVEQDSTLYTFARRPDQTRNSLAETVRHEFAHYLSGRYIFAGVWQAAGYHNEPQGWADEGLAEVLAGLEISSGDYRLALRERRLERICVRAAPRELAPLLAQRDGYDRFGTFDYDHAWSFTYYLLTEQPAVAKRLYSAFRSDSYSLADFARLAGVTSIAELERDWHTAMAGWCANR